MHSIDGVILDFDGTLAPEVPEVAIGVLHETLSRWRTVPLPFIRQYFRAVLAFRVDRSLELLLDSLGLSDHAAEVGMALSTVKAYRSWNINLDPEARKLLQSRKPGRVKIFSSAGVSASRFAPLQEFLPPEAFLSYHDLPKSNPSTWQTIANDHNWKPDRWVVVDDTPLALWAAKSAGFLTVIRTNTVFGKDDADQWSRWIDYRVDSLAELARKFKPQGEFH